MEYSKHGGTINFRLMIDYQLILTIEEFNGKTFDEINAFIKSKSNGRCVLDSAKFYQDGSPQLHTAALTKNYHDIDEKGETILTQDELERLYVYFADLGFPLTTHANGDAAIKSVIKAYEHVNKSC